MENIFIFWTTWEISMRFSGKMWLMIIFKGFTVFLEDAFLEKPQKRGKGGGGGAN